MQNLIIYALYNSGRILEIICRKMHIPCGLFSDLLQNTRHQCEIVWWPAVIMEHSCSYRILYNMAGTFRNSIMLCNYTLTGCYYMWFQCGVLLYKCSLEPVWAHYFAITIPLPGGKFLQGSDYRTLLSFEFSFINDCVFSCGCLETFSVNTVYFDT